MYSFRQATTADYDFLYQLHRSTIKPYVAALWGWKEAWQQEYFQKKFDPTNRQIIQINGEDIGVLILDIKEHEYFISLIELCPDFQGKGIGTSIINRAIKEAHARNLPVTLRVLKSNKRARQLYEKLGFIVINEEKYHYQMICHTPI